MLFCLFFLSPPLYAGVENALAIQAYLQHGKPEQAISTAYMLLDNDNLKHDERKALLELILDAQLIIVKAKHYEDVSPATSAIKTLIQEFPNSTNQPELMFQSIQLYWHENNFEQALAEIIDLQNRFPKSQESQKSWFIRGKIHFLHKKYADARSSFLRFAVAYPPASTEGLEVQMWTALVDYEEGRFAVAHQALQEVLSQQPKLITTQDSIYSRYIQVLRIQKKYNLALSHANAFLAEYKTSSHTPEIRLLRADLKRIKPQPNHDEILKEYNILAQTQADNIIGKQAFMRRMMLQVDPKKTYSEIKPAIIALKRIANANQMSEIEDEALLHEARLWHKVASNDPKGSPKQASNAALEQFSMARKSLNADIAQQALTEGKQAFAVHLKKHIQDQAWENAVLLWQKFKHFRPSQHDGKQLMFQVAHGLRLLMSHQQAEHMLQQLLEQSNGSVWGEKIMLELAKSWGDRRDNNGITKIMQWLDEHEYTIYRPEMLLIVAQLQLHDKQTSLASHTLDSIQPSDVTDDAKAIFWQTRAKTDEALSRWHMAAQAWSQYATFNIPDLGKANLRQAHARFKAGEFPKAELLYSTIPEALQSPVWSYRYSVAQLKNGKLKQAKARLLALKNNPDAGIYTSMAALTLAERETKQLLETSL